MGFDAPHSDDPEGTMLETAGARIQVVFGHPNHELAVFGLLQRIRPHILYLTDGGGADRVAQTKQGLESIGLLDRARFLDFTEDSFYRALLDRDDVFFGNVATEVAGEIERHDAKQVVCDGVEFYNPVHDVSVPIVRRALATLDTSDRNLFEVPLVFQRLSDEESYEVQRARPSRRAQQQSFALTAEETRAKNGARREIYTILIEQIGPTLRGIADEHFESEVVVRHEAVEVDPPEDVTLRYEWRGELLRARGEIDEVITFEGHYLPTVEALLGA